MSNAYRIFGAELSPYSVKVRSYFRYKGIPHEWVVRNSDTQAEFQKHAKLPLVPLVLTPDGRAIQDSTPIIEQIEAAHPEPSIHPQDPALRFLSELIEEFGDEWGNKWMFHYRWAREEDQNSAAERLARTMMPGLDDAQVAATAAGIRERMVGRVWFVGSSEQTAPMIEESFLDGVRILEAHLESRPFLFGARPAFADFGVWGQLYNASTDPTAGRILRDGAPSVTAWCERMLDPEAQGEFEAWEALEATLSPLLERQVGGLFLPWSDANARALEAGKEEFSVELACGTWTQKPQKYHARSLKAIRAKYDASPARAALDPVLEKLDCLRWLRSD